MRTSRGASGVRSWLAMALVGTLLVPATVLVAQGLEATLIDVKGEVEWSPAGATQYQRVGAATVVHRAAPAAHGGE